MNAPLDDVNDVFHAAYDRARDAAERDAPVFIVLGDDLIVRRGSSRIVYRFSPPLFHALKCAAHAPIALYALLIHSPSLDRAARRTLESLLGRIDAALASLDRSVEDRPVRDDMREVFAASHALAREALERGGLAREALDAAVTAFGPLLLRLTDHATRVQLTALHTAVDEAVSELTSVERNHVQIVVAGDHQARARSLAMQYFQKRLHEPSGADDRVTYGERVETEEQALVLVGQRRLDVAIARAFFRDEKRLQRDVLGDAAAVRLRGLELTPIA